MKQAIALIFCALLFAVFSLAGCAGSATQIRANESNDNRVKVEAQDGATVVAAAEKPAAGGFCH